MKFAELEPLVLTWAHEKGIIMNGTVAGQHKKTVEEVTELGLAIDANDSREMMDGYGDAAVTLIIGAHLAGFTLEECIEYAYKEIAGRTGKMVDGVFVKDL